MLRTLTYRILSATDGQTILHYLKSLGYSGPILVHLKKTDHGTLLNGVWAHMNETLHTGDLLCLHLEENTSGTSIFPQQIPLAICYEDEDLLVIDKRQACRYTRLPRTRGIRLQTPSRDITVQKAKSARSAASTGWMPTRAA